MQREAVIFDFELVSKGGYPAYASYIDGMRTKAGLDNFLRGGFKRGQSDVPKDSILDSKDVVIFRGGVSEDGSFKGKLPPGKWLSGGPQMDRPPLPSYPLHRPL